jgi:hypothetical protein
MRTLGSLPTDVAKRPLSSVAWRLARLALKGFGLPSDGQPPSTLGSLPSDVANRGVTP